MRSRTIDLDRLGGAVSRRYLRSHLGLARKVDCKAVHLRLIQLVGCFLQLMRIPTIGSATLRVRMRR